jgi:hypothetical protein
MCITIEQSFGYQIGEKLVFSIRYGIITAGEASLEITEHVFKDSIPTYRILSKARTNSFFDNVFRVRDELESIWEKKNLVTLQFTKRMHEGNYRQHRAHYYYPKQNLSIYMRFNSKSGTSKEETMEIPDNTQDVLSAFYWLRLQDLVVGGEYIINVTADGRNYPAKVIVHNIEKLNTIIGKKDCFVVEPILEGEAIFKQTGKILIWLTADENKIPVKMTSQIVFGSFRAELIEIKNVSYK